MGVTDQQDRLGIVEHVGGQPLAGGPADVCKPGPGAAAHVVVLILCHRLVLVHQASRISRQPVGVLVGKGLAQPERTGACGLAAAAGQHQEQHAQRITALW